MLTLSRVDLSRVRVLSLALAEALRRTMDGWQFLASMQG